MDGPEDLEQRVCAVAISSSAREGLFGPRSVTWTILRETALLLGGPRALLLQLAHPAVSSGVEQHSRIATDPLGRSVRTFEAMYTLCFGDRASALEVVRAVWRRHQVVHGDVTRETRAPSAGMPYRATDAPLLRWVYATLFDTTLSTYESVLGPLDRDARARFYDEGKIVQMAFGIPPREVLPTVHAFDDYVSAMMNGPELDVSAHAIAQWNLVLAQPPSNAIVGALMLSRASPLARAVDHLPLRPIAPAMLRLFAAATLPPRLRDAYGCRWTRADAATFAAVMASIRGAYVRLPASLRFHAAYRHAIARTGA